MTKRFQQVIDYINNLVKSGVLKSEDELFLKKALNDFNHALSVRNKRKAQESVNKICKKLLEKMRL